MGPIELLYVVVIGSAIWVFFDAPANGLSWTWGLGVLALWIVAFPWYLVVRGGVIRAAAVAPRVQPQTRRDGRPAPELLPNGDVLVLSDDKSEMVRVEVGEPSHAEWLAYIQRTQRP